MQVDDDECVERVREKYRAEKERISKGFDRAKERIAAARRPLNYKLAELTRSTYQRKLNVHQLQRELERYGEVSAIRDEKGLLARRRIVTGRLERQITVVGLDGETTRGVLWVGDVERRSDGRWQVRSIASSTEPSLRSEC